MHEQYFGIPQDAITTALTACLSLPHGVWLRTILLPNCLALKWCLLYVTTEYVDSGRGGQWRLVSVWSGPKLAEEQQKRSTQSEFSYEHTLHCMYINFTCTDGTMQDLVISFAHCIHIIKCARILYQL